MVWVPGDYDGALPAALLTDEGPDVYESSPTFAMVKAGQVEPLDDLYTEEVKADFHPNNLAVNTVNGKHLRRQDDRRHGAALLPQEHPRRGRHRPADDDG